MFRPISIAILLLCLVPTNSLAVTAEVEDVKLIARLYSAAFDRIPLINGLNFWVESYESGRSLVDISKDFYQSPEFTSKYGTLSDQQYVEQLYLNVLGRRGAQGGVNFWTGHLSSGVSRAKVLAEFADSPENIEKTSDVFADMYMKGEQWVFGTGYHVVYWRQLEEEIKAGKYTSDSFLYTYLPNLENCDPGVLTEAGKFRARDALNEIRRLHRLTKTNYDPFYDPAVQSAALIQRANNYINHYPHRDDVCYSMLGAEASIANLSLNNDSSNADPASNVIGWLNDRYNVGEISKAGHRRWVLDGGYPDRGQPAKFKQHVKWETGLMDNLDQRCSRLGHPDWERQRGAVGTPHDVTRLLVYVVSSDNGKVFTAKRVKAVLDGDF